MDTRKREGSSDADDVLGSDVVLILNPRVSLGDGKADVTPGGNQARATTASAGAVSSNPGGKIALSGLQDRERELLGLTDGHRSVAELIELSTLSPQVAGRQLRSLLDRGILVEVSTGKPAAASVDPAEVDRIAANGEAALSGEGASALTKAIDDYLELAASALTGADLPDDAEPEGGVKPASGPNPAVVEPARVSGAASAAGARGGSSGPAGGGLGGPAAVYGSDPSAAALDQIAGRFNQQPFRPNVTAFWIPSMAETLPVVTPAAAKSSSTLPGAVPAPASAPVGPSGPVVVVTGSPSEGTARSPGQPSSSQSPFRVGAYEVATRIAQGGMGSIYVCRRAGETGTQRLFTLKVVRQHSAQKDEAVRSFKREAHVGSMLHHPNLQTVLDVGSYKDQPFLVLDYIEGTSLSELISEERRAPLPVIIAIILDVLRGLQHAHGLLDEKGARLGLVHGDVSPQNVLVGVDGLARLTDFGSSSFIGEGKLHEPKWMGTGKPSYMAPEQLRAEPLDGRADIFAVGILMWSALTGQKLFAGETYDETIIKVLRKKIPPPSTFGTPAFLDDVCLKALSRSREGRFSTAEEMARELLRVASEENVLASPADVGQWVRRESGEALAEQRRRIQLMFGSKGPPGRVNTPFAPRVAAATVVLDSQRHFHTPKLGATKTVPSQTVYLPGGRPPPQSFWRTWNVVIVSALLALPVTLTIGYFVSNLLVARAHPVESPAQTEATVVDAAAFQ